MWRPQPAAGRSPASQSQRRAAPRTQRNLTADSASFLSAFGSILFSRTRLSRPPRAHQVSRRISRRTPRRRPSVIPRQRVSGARRGAPEQSHFHSSAAPRDPARARQSRRRKEHTTTTPHHTDCSALLSLTISGTTCAVKSAPAPVPAPAGYRANLITGREAVENTTQTPAPPHAHASPEPSTRAPRPSREAPRRAVGLWGLRGLRGLWGLRGLETFRLRLKGSGRLAEGRGGEARAGRRPAGSHLHEQLQNCVAPHAAAGQAKALLSIGGAGLERQEVGG